MRTLGAIIVLALLLSAAARGAEPRTVQVEGAAHQGTWEPQGIAWQSTYVLSAASASGGRLPLAAPVPAEVTWRTGGEAVAPVRDAAGSVVALDVGQVHGPLVVRTYEPTRAEGSVVLHPPLAEGEVLQRVAVSGTTLRPDDALGLQVRIRRAQPADLGVRERLRLDRLVGRRGRMGALYLRPGDRVAAAGGLPVTLRPEGTVTAGVSAAIAGAFLALLGLGAAIYRLLDRAARRERIDTYVRTELGRAGSGSAPRSATGAEG